MGVLNGIRVLEFEAIGPAPFGVMLLADMGADVIRIDRASQAQDLGPRFEGKPIDVTGRGRRSLALDLKTPEGVQTALALIERAEAEMRERAEHARTSYGPQTAPTELPGSIVYGRN